MTWSKHSKAKHIFVVVRVAIAEEYSDSPWEHRVSGTHAFLDRESALADAARLNTLNGSKGVQYVVVVSRLMKGVQRSDMGGERDVTPGR